MRSIALITVLFFLIVKHGFADTGKHFDRQSVRNAIIKSLPEGETRYIMIEVPAEVYDRSISNSIKTSLLPCASKKMSLVIAGENNKSNYEELRFALKNASYQNFSGCRIVFVGDKTNFDELEILARKIGVEFYAIEYSEK